MDAQCAGKNAQLARSVGVKVLKWKHQAFYLDLRKKFNKVKHLKETIGLLNLFICLFVYPK